MDKIDKIEIYLRELWVFISIPSRNEQIREESNF